MSPLRSVLERSTYARARLLLGMAGVGTIVVLSFLALGVELPARIFGGTEGSVYTNASLLAVWLAGVALVTLPFEVAGGYLLPRYYGRDHPDGGEWTLGWLRGVLASIVIMSVFGALVILGGTFASTVGAVGMVGVLACLLVASQSWMGRVVGGLRERRGGLDALEDELRSLGVVMPPITILESDDEGFTGGIVGLPTAERVVLPLRWLGQLEPSVLAVLIARRTAIIDRGLRALGLVGALVWTMVTFGVASAMPGGGVDSVAGFIGASLWFTILSFFGLLILPTPSRAATRAADAFTVTEYPGTLDRLNHAIASLDALQDDEPERSRTVESIFHPIPSVATRAGALATPVPETAPWHVARTALYLSIVGMNPIARLVHCNVGRPSLWVMLPTDG